MNRTKLKTYAPQARRAFIAAVTDRAAYYGLMRDKIEPMTEQGDVALIGGKPFPRSAAAKRKRLEERITRQGFELVMEAIAYTWFNRLVAIRYMEVHGYLEHGYRVLSHPEGKAIPEILEHAEHVDLPGLDTQKIIELKLDGTREAELYRMLLMAQCNALHSAMPFLFERIDDETELLLPENLLHSDSLIRKLVNSIDEEYWQEVEIIGWLYQFYISEKKDQVIGKVVKSEDIPAATQLFTPNWIVKYLVQNTLGRQWLATYPNSPLRQQMEYYIEPAEQTPEVQEQLKAITPDSLNPEELTLLDPACGSGHILVEAYDLLKAIYQERGYRLRDTPRLILEKNLYGLEIEDRAAQLAAFALMMKACADDRRIFSSGIQPHVLAIQESKGLDVEEITKALNVPILIEQLPPPEYLFEEIEEEKSPLLSRKNLSVKGDIAQASVARLLDLFQHGKTFGSLIRVPEELAEKLPAIAQRVEDVLAYGGMLEQVAARSFRPLVEQSYLLARKYDAIATNPPYMGGGFFTEHLKRFMATDYDEGRADLYAGFILRNMMFCSINGRVSMITIPNWMFLSSFQKLRERLTQEQIIISLVHNGRGVWGPDFGSCSFTVQSTACPAYLGKYKRLYSDKGSIATNEELQKRFHSCEPYIVSLGEFTVIPERPIAYWASAKIRRLFASNPLLRDQAEPKAGISTGNNDACIFYWYEVDVGHIGFNQTKRSEQYSFYPHNKGGGFRKWFGYCDFVLKYGSLDISRMEDYKGFRHDNRELYFRESASWGKVTASRFSARYYPQGFTFDSAGLSVFPDDPVAYVGLLNSNVFTHILGNISPTLNFTVGDVGRVPVVADLCIVRECAEEAIKIARWDWENFETSWGFSHHPLLCHEQDVTTIEECYKRWVEKCQSCHERMIELEQQINSACNEAYHLKEEITSDVDEESITLIRTDLRGDCERLISYAMGCMMGRYSLDEPGLIYAHSGNKGFDPRLYQTFPADEDGIIPLTEQEWFDDAAVNRLEQFIAMVWPREHLEENLKFIAESLGPNRNEQPRETIRRYLATDFYKHHLSMYKRRPIYWLFSSGKQRAFQCLIYLHRYNEGTLSRMRTEYVIPLQGKIASRIDQLGDDIAVASSTSHRKKLEKERDTLIKHQAELHTFDEKLRHYADRRISLDLDDGVKVNYGKFGDLLAEVKTVTGGTEEL